MQEQTAALSELTVERENLLSKIESLEREHSEATVQWQEQMKMKEESMTAEMSNLEISFKESEHMLKEDVEEKANIIQVRLNYNLSHRMMIFNVRTQLYDCEQNQKLLTLTRKTSTC